jgi:hypothetical protein
VRLNRAQRGKPPLKILLVVLAALLLLLLALALPIGFVVQSRLSNPRVERELLADPEGARARKVMLLTLPSGRRLPVNYLREGGRVYAGADGRWWKELEGGPFDVTVWIRGETLAGRARAVRDDPAYTRDVFSRLRPKALPGFGTLVEIRLDPADPGGPAPR